MCEISLHFDKRKNSHFDVVCSVNNDQRLTEICSKKILPSTDLFCNELVGKLLVYS